MPTLVRFLTVLIVLAAIAAAATLYLAYMVEPNTREMTIRIPASKLTPHAGGEAADDAAVDDAAPADAPAEEGE